MAVSPEYAAVRAMALQYGDIADETVNLQFWLMLPNGVKVYVRVTRAGYWADICREDGERRNSDQPKPFTGTIEGLRYFIQSKAESQFQKEPVIELDNIAF